MEKHLHIICLNVPYPVDYGGVFDLFYKLPALQQQRVKIHLHCFEYGRGEQPELNKYCESVHYYKRREGFSGTSTNMPYIVSSRKNDELLHKLLQNDYPILMEGVHCTYLLNDKRFSNRRCIVRLHNVEYIYYRHLYQSAPFGFRKLYYWWESKLLYNYEKRVCNNAAFLPVSVKDTGTYHKIGCKDVHFLPLFLPPWELNVLHGRGSFCLYQGDLSVDENQKAAKWLLHEIFNDLDIPFVIAGKEPPQWLIETVRDNSNACLVANPTEQEMQDMIAKAHIHVIPSFNSTGIKLKLLNALYNGRHCIVNAATVEGTGLEPACHITDDPGIFKAIISKLYKEEFRAEEAEIRKELLSSMFNNETNAIKLMELIWGKNR